jgi:hypothetical protein
MTSDKKDISIESVGAVLEDATARLNAEMNELPKVSSGWVPFALGVLFGLVCLGAAGLLLRYFNG